MFSFVIFMVWENLLISSESKSVWPDGLKILKYVAIYNNENLSNNIIFLS